MKQQSNQISTVAIAIIIVVGVLGFLGGMKYQSIKQPTPNRQFTGARDGSGMQNGGMRNGAGGRGGMNRPVTGEVISSDEKSITVKLPDGSSKIVLVTTTTAINKATQATKTDIITGSKVAVFGQTNSDGSVTAQNIQLNPITNMRGETGAKDPKNSTQ